ncbi:MAG: VWA domain-containing protein [Candidatus Sulfotelmatobacter sp.]
MKPVRGNGSGRSDAAKAALVLALVFFLGLAMPGLWAQSGNSQTQPPPAKKDADLPDAPSVVQPPPPPPPPPALPVYQQPEPGQENKAPQSGDQQPADQEKPAPPPMPPIQTVPAGTYPRNQINLGEDLYKISVSTNLVLVPVLVQDPGGRRVDGLLPRDFTVLENGKPQKLTFFSSDPIQLSVAILIDIGMPDVAVQKLNQTYSALVGALSPYDEAALYTYSSTVSQVTDFTRRSEKLSAALNALKLVRGDNNGPAVLTGPMAAGPPTVNGAPVGGPTIQTVNTPPREAHVLNDAILRAAVDLSKRDRTRRKVIFVISDGRELGSRASYRDVLRVLESRDIQVKAVVVEGGSLPAFRQVGKIHLFGQGYFDILPKYSGATGGGEVLHELSRNAIEDAYAQITSEARNQYTLGYSPKATTGSSAYRSIEVRVDYRHLKIAAKDGYYPAPAAAR